MLDLSRHLVKASELGPPISTIRFPTRLAALDSLLGGGLPRGSLVEITATTTSSGRFSMGLAALAAATREGQLAALVDLDGHLDPQSAASFGIDLPRLLWVRPKTVQEALTSTESIVGAGFFLVALDLGLKSLPSRLHTAFLRLSRLARIHRTIVLVLTPCPLCGTAAQAVITASHVATLWQRRLAAQPLLTGLTTRLELKQSPTPLSLHLKDAFP